MYYLYPQALRWWNPGKAVLFDDQHERPIQPDTIPSLTPGSPGYVTLSIYTVRFSHVEGVGAEGKGRDLTDIPR